MSTTTERSFNYLDGWQNCWYARLAEKVGEQLEDKKTGTKTMVFLDPMEGERRYLLHAPGIADTVLTLCLYEEGDGALVMFQPAIPQEVTFYETKPPVKAKPLNDDIDMATLAEAIAIFAKKDFLNWQASAILESRKEISWRAVSTQFLESLSKEAWCPVVAVADNGDIKASIGRMQAKASPGKLTLTFYGKSADYLDIIRGALRDEHRRREAQRHEEEQARENEDAGADSMDLD